MGILSSQRQSLQPSPTLDPDTCDTDRRALAEPDALGGARAKTFLEGRWDLPAAPVVPFFPVPVAAQTMTDHPAFDALHARSLRHAEDGTLCVEFDGFLVDEQMATVGCGCLHETVAA